MSGQLIRPGEDIEAPSSCFSCGKKEGAIKVRGAMGPGYLACSSCYLRHGRKELAGEADRMFMIALESPKYGRCLHCNRKVTIDPRTAAFPLQCDDCNGDLLRLVSENRAKGLIR